MDELNIEKRLRDIRARFSLNQTAMASKIGCSAPAYKEYERGIKTPGGKVLAGLAGAGVNINWLLTGQGSMLQKDQSHTTIDMEALTAALTLLEDYLLESGGTLPPAKKAALAAFIYDEATKDNGQPITKGRVIQLVRLAT